MIEVDQVINSQRVLETGKYQTKRCFTSEEKWLIKYMVKNGYKKDEIGALVKKLYRSRMEYEPSVEDETAYFEKMWLKAWKDRAPLFVNREITIYKDELEYINSKHTLPWIKELALLILAYFKFYNANKLSMVLVPMKYLVPLTTLGRRRCGSNTIMWQTLRKMELIDYEEKTFTCRPFVKSSEGDEIIKIDTMADLDKLCGLVENKMICSQCGKEFEYSSKTQREICPECWQKQRENGKNFSIDGVKRLHHEPIGITITFKTCLQCGVTFESNGKTKRDICPTCWTRRRLILQNMLHKKKRQQEKGRHQSVNLLL